MSESVDVDDDADDADDFLGLSGRRQRVTKSSSESRGEDLVPQPGKPQREDAAEPPAGQEGQEPISRSLQLIDALPQPNRRAFTRGISVDMILASEKKKEKKVC